MEEIDFEGKLVKPDKSGYYRCPYGCHNKDYPKPKWKTKAGFLKHTTKCPKRPSALKVIQEKDDVAKNLLEQFKVEVLNELPYKVGDTIYYVREIIVQDTHEWRGNRRVKVRYEAIKRFVAEETIIKSINFNFSTYLPNKEYVRDDLMFFNSGIRLSSLCNNLEEAKKKAHDKQVSYEEHCRFSSMVR